MPSPEVLERFIKRVEDNAHAEAIEEFYTSNATMRENQSEPRAGREALAAREREQLAKAWAVQSKCVRPVFVDGHYTVIRWIFDFEWLDGGTTHLEELTWQRWEGDRIAEEQFFYDPAQLMPLKPDPPA